MARHSERLISLGYYDDGGEKPRVSYKENLKRIFHKKRRSQFGSPGTANTEPAMDDTGDQTPPSAIMSNTSLNDFDWVTLSDISHTLIGDEWDALTPLDKCTRPLDQSTRPLDQSTRPLDQFTRPLDQSTRPLDQFTRPLDQSTRPLDQSTRPLDQSTRPLDQSTRPLDQSTRPLDQSTRPLDQSTRPLDQSTWPAPVRDEAGDQNTRDRTEQPVACYDDHRTLKKSPWKSGYSEFESLKLLRANLKQLQEELIQLRSKLLPKGLSMPNFALESQGARVLHAYPSQNYRSPAEPPLVMFLGIPVFYPFYSPSTAIQGHTEALVPGRCWSFAGQQGQLFVSLSQPVIVSHVTLGHISREHAPYGLRHSAPQHFSVSGYFSEEGEATHLGTFEYDLEGESFQTFEFPCSTKTYRYVMLEILSNWGHPEYTCVYSFKVHGKIKQYHN